VVSDERPTASIEPQKHTLQQGSNVTIHCQVTGSPTPTVRWSKVRSEFGPNQRVSNCRKVYILNAKNNRWSLTTDVIFCGLFAT